MKEYSKISLTHIQNNNIHSPSYTHIHNNNNNNNTHSHSHTHLFSQSANNNPQIRSHSLSPCASAIVFLGFQESLFEKKKHSSETHSSNRWHRISSHTHHSHSAHHSQTHSERWMILCSTSTKENNSHQKRALRTKHVR